MRRRIFGFNVYKRSPQVVLLPVHLLGEHSVVFNPHKRDEVKAVLEQFEVNQQEAAVTACPSCEMWIFRKIEARNCIVFF